MASKFPGYTFEIILDKTPLWLGWAMMQAAKLDQDLLKKINMVLGTADSEPKKPTTISEENAALRAMGFKIKRAK